MNESKFMYFLAAMTVIFLALLQACWFLVRTIIGAVWYFLAFFTVGLLFGAVISSPVPHEHV